MAKPVYDGILALDLETVFIFHMLGNLIHEVAIQMQYGSATYALEVQMVLAVLLFSNILEHSSGAVFGDVFHHLSAFSEFVQKTVYCCDVDFISLIIEPF